MSEEYVLSVIASIHAGKEKEAIEPSDATLNEVLRIVLAEVRKSAASLARKNVITVHPAPNDWLLRINGN